MLRSTVRSRPAVVEVSPDAVTWAFTSPAARGQVYNLSTVYLTWREVADSIVELTGGSRRYFRYVARRVDPGAGALRGEVIENR